jgi:hypothetical protein
MWMLLRMNGNISSGQPMTKGAGLEKGRAPDVVLACENFATGMHALGAFDEVFPAGDSGQLPGAQSVWKFELLGVTSLREAAAAEAAGAQMVIISAHAPGELPPAVRSWVEKWTKNRQTEGGALVLLLDDAGAGMHERFPVETYLENQAAGAGMTYSTHKAAGRHAIHDLNLALDAKKIPGTLKGLTEALFAEQAACGHPIQPGIPRF